MQCKGHTYVRNDKFWCTSTHSMSQSLRVKLDASLHAANIFRITSVRYQQTEPWQEVTGIREQQTAL